MRMTIMLAAVALSLAACAGRSDPPSQPAPGPTSTPALDAYGCPIGGAWQQKCDDIAIAKGAQLPVD